MFRSIFAFVVAAALSGAAFAADASDKAAHQTAMQKVAFLVGDWEGSGSIAMGPGPRQTFAQTEHITLKHDGTLLLIEGQGKSPAGAVVHDALAVVTFDPKSGGYKFRSFAAPGRFADSEASVDGNTFVWHLIAGPRKVRYTITVENGTWREIGENSTDGTSWAPFFEMTLKRK